ncbi:mitochondrial calcium uniporter regulator 1 [Lingula anatina]|uniref:Mitochondrial calcium uniporter regulator 1 n=1 Tax=Lingula anatina TaxID=7574 RepID=A0A1S3JPQ3_LINAN|nr:mitochondrial calcium uniporter regulator 1 [Lingula anatina]|eukprot:XP_013412337.1 mitochondrial calcium uniporter regulator 1 [Lingula anatina]
MAAPSFGFCAVCKNALRKTPSRRLFSSLSHHTRQRDYAKTQRTGQSTRCLPQILPVRRDSSSVPEKEIRGNSRLVDLTPHRTFNFDTHALIKHLESSGFTSQQAEGLSSAFIQILNAQIDQQTKTMVYKGQLEITTQQIMAEISSVKKDMVILEKSEFSTLKNENEKKTLELNRLKDNMSDGFAKLQSGVKLDINLERSRSQEAHATNEKTLSRLENRIDTEVANLKTLIELYRSDYYKYVLGLCMTLIVGVVIASLRTVFSGALTPKSSQTAN